MCSVFIAVSAVRPGRTSPAVLAAVKVATLAPLPTLASEQTPAVKLNAALASVEYCSRGGQVGLLPVASDRFLARLDLVDIHLGVCRPLRSLRVRGGRRGRSGFGACHVLLGPLFLTNGVLLLVVGYPGDDTDTIRTPIMQYTKFK